MNKKKDGDARVKPGHGAGSDLPDWPGVRSTAAQGERERPPKSRDRGACAYSAAILRSSSAADRIGKPSIERDGLPSTPMSGSPTSVMR